MFPQIASPPTRPLLWLTLTTFSLMLPGVAEASSGDVSSCQQAKIVAIGKLDRCLQRQVKKRLAGRKANTLRCYEKFDQSILEADEKLDDTIPQSECRWLGNVDPETTEPDGTVTDLDTGLVWELKTQTPGRHHYLNHYTWSESGTEPNGTAFVEFLGELNGGVQTQARSTNGCFANHCDWRIPTISELRTIVNKERPACSGMPGACITIPGETGTEQSYLSSTTVSDDDTDVWVLNFATPPGFGRIDQQPPLEKTEEKLATDGGYVRAVRGRPSEEEPTCGSPILIKGTKRTGATVKLGYTEKVIRGPLNSSVDNAIEIVDEMTKKLSQQAVKALNVTTVVVFHCDPYLVTGARDIQQEGQPDRIANNYESARYDYLTLLSPTSQCKDYQQTPQTFDDRSYDATIGVGVPQGGVVAGPKCVRDIEQNTCYTTTICDANLVSSSTVEHHDAYPNESILVHEFGHTVMNVGLNLGSSEEQQRYQSIIDFFHDTYSPKYCSGEDSDIYSCQGGGEEMWAEATQGLFGASVGIRCGDPEINPGLCPASVIEKDLHGLAQILAETYGEQKEISPLPPFNQD